MPMLLSGCAGGDVTVGTDESVVESVSETLDKGTESDRASSNQDYPKNMWIMKTEKGVSVRHVTIDVDGDIEPIEIVQITDMHISYVNEQDLADPVIKSTYENRSWGKNGGFMSNAIKCLEYAKNTDQIVLTGDIYDYLTEETAKQVKEKIFDKYSNIMAVVGNHEPVRQVQGKVTENTTLEQRLDILQRMWANDIYYSSKVIGDKVMLIQMDNGSAGVFLDSQIPLLRADLMKARENGYAVLLFYHIPLSTGNSKYYSTKAITVGDAGNTFANFYSIGINASSSGASGEIYNLIINNGDIIKGCFCGHKHCDYYTEIDAKTADGTATVIPQYILIGAAYGPNVLKVTVK